MPESGYNVIVTPVKKAFWADNAGEGGYAERKQMDVDFFGDGEIDAGMDDIRMRRALQAALEAAEEGEVPVGAVVYYGDRLVGRAYNQREILRDPTAHAEILAITQAAAALESWRLEGCTMYVTLEPCAMCAGALVLSRMDRVVFGAWDPKAGACGSVLDVLGCERLNHTVEMTAGVLADECGGILTDFFKSRRERKNNRKTDS